ncbi:hypothetical protein CRG98_003638 [Punica granatum]|uniref:Uncharacterized protein n=1 Tax=Punica granatum TaxID=22663 RepID=A0A2I0L5T1_PUNGR|nr:hypothetical protein CRG98_003638 [Punica granatum]
MARRAMTRGRLARPPTPHDQRVVPTFVGRPPAAFTLPPWQGELWTEGRPTFPGNSQQEDSLNTERPQLRQQTSLIQLLGISTLSLHPYSTEQDHKQIRVTALQRLALFLRIDRTRVDWNTATSTPSLMRVVSVTRPHGKVDTPKPRDPKARNVGPDESLHSGSYNGHDPWNLYKGKREGSLGSSKSRIQRFDCMSKRVSYSESQGEFPCVEDCKTTTRCHFTLSVAVLSWSSCQRSPNFCLGRKTRDDLAGSFI